MILRDMDVQVTLLAGTSHVAQTSVTVTALDPGKACEKAYPLMREDVKGRELPKITAVHFLVRVSKEKKPS